MRLTDTEQQLLIKQLRKARDEVVRAKLMMKAVATDEDHATVEDLTEMAHALTGHIEAIVKAVILDDEDEADND
jgi:hypothetical protein